MLKLRPCAAALWLAISLFSISPSWAKESSEYPNFQIETITHYLPEMQRITEHYKAGDVVVFDLDNTVFREVQQLGTDEWYSHVFHQKIEEGLTSEQAHAVLGPTNRAIKHRSKMRLMEEGLPQFIHELQKRGVYTIGLTARHPMLAPSTIKNLEKFDIQFARSSFPTEQLQSFTVPGLKNAFLYRSGIMFTDGATKGRTLKQILLKTGVRPQHLAAIDDRISHVESYVETIQEFDFEGLLIHYLKALELPPFEPEVAEAQLRVFHKLGILLSDDEARSYLKRNSHHDDSHLSWRCSKLLLPSPEL